MELVGWDLTPACGVEDIILGNAAINAAGEGGDATIVTLAIATVTIVAN